jgi:hypothetical protein
MTAIAIYDRSTFLTRSYSTGSSEASQKLQKLCYEGNWDGYGALPVSQATYDEAVRFLNALPSWLPTPEIVPEPSGDIGFEWNFGKNRVLAASVNGTNRITYAGLLGTGNKAHGTEVFDGSIPQALVDHISRISPKVAASG